MLTQDISAVVVGPESLLISISMNVLSKSNGPLAIVTGFSALVN